MMYLAPTKAPPLPTQEHDAFFTVNLFVREKRQKFRNISPAQSNFVDTGWTQQKLRTFP
jgi:hypothetical protein